MIYYEKFETWEGSFGDRVVGLVGKKAGRLFRQSGHKAIAYLRVDREKRRNAGKRCTGEGLSDGG